MCFDAPCSYKKPNGECNVYHNPPSDAWCYEGELIDCSECGRPLRGEETICGKCLFKEVAT